MDLRAREALLQDSNQTLLSTELDGGQMISDERAD